MRDDSCRTSLLLLVRLLLLRTVANIAAAVDQRTTQNCSSLTAEGGQVRDRIV